MKILLINPNRYRTPPVPPLGLEYLENALRETRHECRILDLCFSDNPLLALEEEINDFNPDVAGMTVRNIDTVLFHNNVFFLDDIKMLVDHLKNLDIPVILGGSGYSFIPEGILRYLGADWGVYGPGEKALVHLLDTCESEPPYPGKVFNGWEYGFDPDSHVERGDTIDYVRYSSEGGLAGFETQKGCMERCSYCPEGRGAVTYRNPERIVEELRTLADRGYTDFHLCDTEFNQDLSFCHRFLETLIDRGPRIRWTLYMKTFPYDEDLFLLMKRSGTHLITLSIPAGKDALEHTRKITRFARKQDIRIAVDLLLGFPGDTVESVKRTVDRMRDIGPDTVGINATIRLYPNISVTRVVLDSQKYRENLIGAVNDNPDMIRPVFYNHITVDTLRDIIGDDPLFRIEGFERTTNYERLKQVKTPGS